jgi:hypothetical protein
MYNGGRMIEVMWIILGKWILEKMLLNKWMPARTE